MSSVLALDNVMKSFGAIQALHSVSLNIRPNEIVGLIGENGAGKSTLMRVLAGIYPPDHGQMRVNGKLVQLNGAMDARAHGIGMVFQEQSLFSNLSVGHNIFLGREQRFMRFGLIQWKKLYAAAARQLEKLQLKIDPRTLTSELDFATRQMVELAKALTLEEDSSDNLIILLDEPTSVLEQAEIDILFDKIRALRSRASFVFVSHRLDEVLAISDRVYVLRDGQVVAHLQSQEADETQLHHLMVGHHVKGQYYGADQSLPYRDEIVLQAENLSLNGRYQQVSFNLHEGEVLGIVGVVGSGREELARTFAGLLPPTSGCVCIRGKVADFSSPAAAVEQGIGYIPRERRVEGLILFLSIANNISLGNLDVLTRFGLIDRAKERMIADKWLQKLRIRAPDMDALCLNLSGGNQQKVVLAKWLHAGSRILILDHPTRGLDVGAKREVYDLIHELTAMGISVILTSDTLEEAIGLSHTLIVMRDGQISHRVDMRHLKVKPADLIGYMV